MDKPIITQDQLEMDNMAEAELARLQRQYRIMENDRKAYKEEMSIKLAKQRKIIALLRNEKEKIFADLNVANSAIHKRTDVKMSKKINDLLDKYDEICTIFREEKGKLDEIEEQIKKTERQLLKLKTNEISDEDYKITLESGKKSIKMLKNKLETVTKKFCSVLAENKFLREEIDHLLKERARFNEIWEKLLDDLSTGKKYLLDLVEQATIAYDQREEWCNKLQALKIRQHNDVIAHTQEMREMQRQLDYDGKLREFLSVKGQKRIMKDLEEKERLKQEEAKEEQEKQIEIYKETLSEIKQICDEEDIDRIATKFLKQEEENFALFNYVNELTHEMQELSEAIDDVKAKIEEQKQLTQEKAEKDKNSKENLELLLKQTMEKTELDGKAVQKAEIELKEVLSGIENLFSLLSCDMTPILELLGEDNKININNVMVYLGFIEKTISILVTNTYFKERVLTKGRKSRRD